eukprot:TRINITY_DN2826_c0_g1_i2.p1 TRINITY_DN2826_c0_g1~~TRINITY_DN2826_c0_g1_i2.p1  ORF type:complete len:293 (+),score=32.47 TRINITY_DN2826_c0_g1_i2:493-1371(+)
MRTACVQAGMIASADSLSLVFVPQPEAAFIYMAYDPELRDGGHPSAVEVRSGYKFLVLDCGDSTVNISAHEIDGSIYPSEGADESGPIPTFKPLISSSSGPCGTLSVDLSFENDFLRPFLGAALFDLFRASSNYRLWMDGEFGELKRLIMTKGGLASGPKRLNMTEPLDCSDDETTSLAALVERWNADKRSPEFQLSAIGRYSIQLSNDLCGKFFQPQFQLVISTVDRLMSLPDLTGLNAIVMTGGFGANALLADQLRKLYETDTCKVVQALMIDLIFQEYPLCAVHVCLAL